MTTTPQPTPSSSPTPAPTPPPATPQPDTLPQFASDLLAWLQKYGRKLFYGLAVAFIPLLVLLAYGDQLGGVELQGVHDFYVVVVQLVALWLMAAGLAAPGVLSRYVHAMKSTAQESNHSATKDSPKDIAKMMVGWDSVVIMLGVVLVAAAYVLRRWTIDATVNTVDDHVSDAVSFWIMLLVIVLGVLPSLWREIRNMFRHKWMDKVAQVLAIVMPPLFTASAVTLCGVLAWQMWETSLLSQSISGISGDVSLPCLLSAYCIAVAVAALATLRSVIVHSVRLVYLSALVRLTVLSPHRLR